jgi:hypothetical protein
MPKNILQYSPRSQQTYADSVEKLLKKHKKGLTKKEILKKDDTLTPYKLEVGLKQLKEKDTLYTSKKGRELVFFYKKSSTIYNGNSNETWDTMGDFLSYYIETVNKYKK